jgi:Flp pilus assembly protein TadG
MKRPRRESGSALIEFSGSLILLATLLTGIFQVGYTLYTYENLVQAVRAGARYAALGARESAGDPEFAKAVRNLVVYGDPKPAPQAKPVAPGFGPEHVDLVLEPSAATVSLRGFTIDALFRKIPLNGRPLVTFPIAPRGSR